MPTYQKKKFKSYRTYSPQTPKQALLDLVPLRNRWFSEKSEDCIKQAGWGLQRSMSRLCLKLGPPPNLTVSYPFSFSSSFCFPPLALPARLPMQLYLELYISPGKEQGRHHPPLSSRHIETEAHALVSGSTVGQRIGVEQMSTQSYPIYSDILWRKKLLNLSS